jgi:CRP/FNR family transcriptional regulator
MRHLCMPEGLSPEETEKVEDVISATRAVRCGEALFRTGDPFDSLYAIRSGSIKSVVSREGGREQVTGLYLSGDALGLDGIGENRHMSTAIALEDSSVCIVPYARFERVCRETGSIQRRLHQMMSRRSSAKPIS